MIKTANGIGQDALRLIGDLRDHGISNIAVLIRHSARVYDDKDPLREPFMELTDEGKELSYEFGRHLPTDSLVRFFSSPVCRCVETAYQMEKGNISKGGMTETNKIRRALNAYYLNDLLAVMKRIDEIGSVAFFREWFNYKIPLSDMADPEESGQILLKYFVDSLSGMQNGHLDIHVTHDWNLYLLKEYYLNLTLEDVGKAEYLEGVILYQEGGEFYITNHQTEPQCISI